jgi:DNA replication protein DnaC
MLIHPTLTKLENLRLYGMMRALREQMDMPEAAELSFEERLGLLIDRETTEKESLRLSNRIKRAHLRQSAAPEDVDLRKPRGLDRAQFMALCSCIWIKDRDNCLITGATGVGKTYLACALAQKACREGHSVAYFRTTRMLEEIALSRANGTYARRLASLARLDLIVLDDWGIAPLGDEQRRDLLEVLDDRYDRRSTLIAAQLPVEHWHDYLADPALADAILDRLIHNAHRVALSGDSMRRRRASSEESSADADTAERA